MRVLKSETVTRTFQYIETDDRDWPEHRRWSADNWEVLMGDSWEAAYDDRLEKAYQEYINGRVG